MGFQEIQFVVHIEQRQRSMIAFASFCVNWPILFRPTVYIYFEISALMEILIGVGGGAVSVLICPNRITEAAFCRTDGLTISSSFSFQTKYLLLIGWISYAVVMVAVKIISHRFEGKQSNPEKNDILQEQINPFQIHGLGACIV